MHEKVGGIISARLKAKQASKNKQQKKTKYGETNHHLCILPSSYPFSPPTTAPVAKSLFRVADDKTRLTPDCFCCCFSFLSLAMIGSTEPVGLGERERSVVIRRACVLSTSLLDRAGVAVPSVMAALADISSESL